MSKTWVSSTIDLSSYDDQLDFDFNTTSMISNSSPYTVYGTYGATGASGTVGATLSTSLTGPTWTNNTITAATAMPYTVATGSISNGYGINLTQSGHNLHVNGGAIFEKDITVQGVKLNERLDAIEERLAILRPNNDLENKWQELKELGEKYRQLEKEILEKERIWETLKK